HRGVDHRTRRVPDRPAPVRVIVMGVVAAPVAVAAPMAATVETTMEAAVSAGGNRIERDKAERGAGGDGQKGRFAKHGTLLPILKGSFDFAFTHWSGSCGQRFRSQSVLPTRFQGSLAVVNRWSDRLRRGRQAFPVGA